MSNRTTQSAWVVAGAAAGAAAAATWLKRRQLVDVSTDSEALVEPESAELPVGRSADPAIDDALSRKLLPQDDTSGSALLAGTEPFMNESSTDASLDEVWNSLPGIAEGEQSEGYDAVSPEDLGSVWLERATQTTHESRPHGSDPTDIPDLESLLVSESTLAASRMPGEDDEGEGDEDDGDEEPESERIADDELG